MYTLPEEDQATPTGNMHKNLLKIGCVVPEICSQTDTGTTILNSAVRFGVNKLTTDTNLTSQTEH